MITAVEGRPLGDEELVDLARSGDAVAYGRLVKRYQGLAQRVAYIVTGSSIEAEEAAQEAFVKAYYALPRFSARSPFKPWLLKIVTNEARNRRRSAGRREKLALKATSLAGGSPDVAPSPEAQVTSSEEARLLLDAVNALGEKDRLAITYRYFLELNEAEMAVALGWARGTVKSRLSRAMGRLREQLEERP